MATTAPETRKSPPKATAKPAATKAAPKRAPQRRAAPQKSIRQRINTVDVPRWATTVASVVGVSAAIGGALFATRKQWWPQAEEWANGFSAAFADDETDPQNFDQTRHAGRDSMRDDQGDDWEDIDDQSDASFPASDPPSFNPGTA